MPQAKTWDIFCAVVDNYGDIGVCWRLARQLAAEHGLRVRLWVDELARLGPLCPEVDPGLPRQHHRGVDIRHWPTPFPDDALGHGVGDVVVEAFACELPALVIVAMAAREPRPRWINLEYLSAEDWVPGCHGLASPHPSLPLVKHFFFPGFVPSTGGLLREAGLQERIRAFRRDARSQARFWQSLGLPAARGELRVSLFGYENPALAGLLEAWAGGGSPLLCLVPEGRPLADLSAWCGRPLQAGDRFAKGSLEARVLPFLEQGDYDRLLWACDFNFVRGEDSFVRAQWAARPFTWHIYPQAEDAHWPKLQAFLDLYCTGLEEPAAAGLRLFWEAWNRGSGAGEAWPAFLRQRTVLAAHAERWAQRQGGYDDLAASLVRFCQTRL